MRLSFFTLQNILLFEATLALYARFVGAVTPNASSCGGCTVTAAPRTLTYPSDVSEVTQSVTATVIPFIYQYDNGTEVTSYSTYTASAGVQSIFTSPSHVTWTTLGTVLTYPTTYLAFISPFAGVSKSQTGANGFCYASLTTIAVPTSDYSNLIFPSSTPADHDKITSAASEYIDTLPSITAAVSPYKPGACSHFIGTDLSKSPSATSPALSTSRTVLGSAEPVTHTSVAFLLQTGKPVITKVPAVGQNQGGGSSPGGTTPGGSTPGGTTTPKGSTTPPTSMTPILNVGGSIITAGPSGDFAIGTRTLTRGGSAVVDGTTVVLATDGSVAVINGQTSTLSATYTGPAVNSDASRVGLSGLAIAALGCLGFWL